MSYSATEPVPVEAAAPSRRISDFRSDTVTLPSAEMYAAMTSAPVGDDVYGEDPTVTLLEQETAAAVGKAAGLFVPSGTMGNLLALLTHCDTRGSEALVGAKSHINIFEQGGAATLGGVHMRTLANNADGTFSLTELAEMIKDGSNVHCAQTRVVCAETTHNLCGGSVPPLQWLAALRDVVNKTNGGDNNAAGASDVCAAAGPGAGAVAVHYDGARVWNAAVALGVSPAVVAEHCDSISVCVSKGLGAPVGAVLCGSKVFIAKARRTRKALGGGMRQAGVIAAAALYALRNNVARMADDHRRAKELAAFINELGRAAGAEPPLSVDEAQVHSNLVYCVLSPALLARGVTAGALAGAMEASHGVRVSAMAKDKIRFVTHLNVGDDDVAVAKEALKQAVAKFAAAQ